MTSQMTIGKKLMLSFAGVVLMVLGLAYSSLRSIGSLVNSLDTAVNNTAKKVEIAEQLDCAAAYLRVGQRGVILYSVLKEPAIVERSKETFLSTTARIEKLAAELKPMVASGAGRESVETIQTQLANWQPLYQEIVQMSAAGRFDTTLNATVNKTIEMADQIQKAAQELQQREGANLAAASKDAQQTSSRSRWIATVMIGLCLALGAVVVWIVRQISGTLRQIAAEMGDGAEQVAAAASQVSSASQSLAQGSSEQAASIEQTSASTEEINSMSQKNAENSKVAADNMVEAAQRIDEANRNLGQMVTSMNEINASSEKIGKIIKVIDEIAFQTNILALNAAVEAARAGEAGMGFAVVADEVRNLAQRCAQAAKDTAGLIEESISKSNDGKTKLDQVAKAVASITGSATKVKTLVDEVKLGSEEQARGIEQVAKAITQMEKVTQTTAANAEESASASEELSAQSDTLRAIVARLNGMVGGGSEASSRSVRRHPLGHANLRSGRNSHLEPASGSPDHRALPAPAAVIADKSAFPLEDDFKEF